MQETSKIDQMDRKILTALQNDARLTNNELADQIGLSPSQCSRRRSRLEADGIITGYHAKLDRSAAGFGLISIISVTLATHNADNASILAQLFEDLPNVLEAYAMTGEMDYHVKVITPDLKTLSDFINSELLAHEAVQNVKTAIVLEVLKDGTTLPV